MLVFIRMLKNHIFVIFAPRVFQPKQRIAFMSENIRMKDHLHVLIQIAMQRLNKNGICYVIKEHIPVHVHLSVVFVTDHLHKSLVAFVMFVVFMAWQQTLQKVYYIHQLSKFLIQVLHVALRWTELNVQVAVGALLG